MGTSSVKFGAVLLATATVLGGCTSTYNYPPLYPSRTLRPMPVEVVTAPPQTLAPTTADIGSTGAKPQQQQQQHQQQQQQQRQQQNSGLADRTTATIPAKPCTYFTARSATEPGSTHAILDAAAELQCLYADYYVASARQEDLSQLPLLALGLLSGFTLLNDKKDAATDVAKLGVLGLTYSGTRGALVAKDLPQAYLAGHLGIGCMIGEGHQFAGSNAMEIAKKLDSTIGNLQKAITDLEQSFGQVPNSSATPADLALLTTTRQLALGALVDARTVLQTGLRQARAYRTAPRTFHYALTNISTRVATLGRSREDVDYEELVGSFPKSSTASVAVGSAGIAKAAFDDQRPAAADLIGQINEKVQLLLTATSEAEAATPDYIKALERTAECANKVEIKAS
ncbi:hypothetical protein HME9302_01368 [Alteripontixanthobacter maritimus]|uniref:Uncharacterized protein n=1 Tax=Alteripontixanthobacter maritimus TaxID=2161824 RepID=A0A369QB79_9SPHN|nr:hypothetical protein [Alteripontixanthobacter maritimus]RDC60169.1 hypothetical protein HME9302_01368 [Alteripontixanthobacter maritimus]